MQEWMLSFKPWNGKNFTPCHGMTESKEYIGDTPNDTLICSMNFFRGLSYYELYTSSRSENFIKPGVWLLRFYLDVGDGGTFVADTHDILLMVDNISFNNDTQMTVIRFVNYAEFFIDDDYDIDMVGDPSMIAPFIIEKIVNAYINKEREDRGYKVYEKRVSNSRCNVKFRMSNMEKSPMKSLYTYSWHGNGMDMLSDIAKKFDFEFLIIGDTIYFGPQVNIEEGASKPRGYKIIPRDKSLVSSFGAYTSVIPGFFCGVIGSIVMYEQEIFRIVQMDYSCDDEGVDSHITLLLDYISMLEKDVVSINRTIIANIIKNKTKHIACSTMGISNSDEYNTLTEVLNPVDTTNLTLGVNTDKLISNMYHTVQLLNRDKNYFYTMLKADSSFPIYDVNHDKEIRVLRTTPFAGSESIYQNLAANINNGVDYPNKTWGLQYPETEGSVEIVDFLDNDYSKPYVASYWWNKEPPWRASKYDYRLTLVDGSTIYGDARNKYLALIGKNYLLLQAFDNIQGESQSYNWNISSKPQILITSDSYEHPTGVFKFPKDSIIISTGSVPDPIFIGSDRKIVVSPNAIWLMCGIFGMKITRTGIEVNNFPDGVN